MVDDAFPRQDLPGTSWANYKALPRLTPSPPPEPDSEPELDLTRPSTPPPRKSIYQNPHTRLWHVNVQPYNTDWPGHFTTIQTHLHRLFTTSQPPAPYLTIEHIGSTSVPGLCAKPNIDVLVTFASQADLAKAIEALTWEIPNTPPFASYTRIPNGGGIKGRESFKIYLPETSPYYASTPERNVYLVADCAQNPHGQVQVRCYRTLRDVLRDGEHADLRVEYARVKWELAGRVWTDGLQYTSLKDGVVRKVLKRGGWADEEVDEKEQLARREFTWSDEEAY